MRSVRALVHADYHQDRASRIRVIDDGADLRPDWRVNVVAANGGDLFVNPWPSRHALRRWPDWLIARRVRLDTKDNKAWLRQRKIRNRILKKGAHHIKLSSGDKRRNREKGRVRGNIERIFGHLKKWQGYRRVRYLGLAKNQLELTLKAVAYNLKRLVKIMELSAT